MQISGSGFRVLPGTQIGDGSFGGGSFVLPGLQPGAGARVLPSLHAGAFSLASAS